MQLKIKEKSVKSVLTKSGFPSDDFCINPYSGCSFGCSYCFADFTRRFTGHTKDKWGAYVDVKVNAPEVLEKELVRLKNRFKHGGLNQPQSRLSIIIGSVTDPYQGVEAKYKITRKCLEAIVKIQPMNFTFSILTKSPLVTRDIDLLKKIKNISVGLTITATDDKITRIFEIKAPPASLRIEALKKLSEAGVRTYVCVNPILPHLIENKEKIHELLDKIYKTGCREVWFEHINLSTNKFSKIKKALKKVYEKDKNYFKMVKLLEMSKSKESRKKLEKVIKEVLKSYNFRLGGGKIFEHGK